MQVGQKVWIECTDYGRKGEVRESEITKIGRKYVYVGDMRFYIDTMQEDAGVYASNRRLWLSKQDYEDNRELDKNFWELKRRLDSYKPTITLDQSRAMLAILEAKETVADGYYDLNEYIIADNDGENDGAPDLGSANKIAYDWLTNQSDPTGYKVGVYKRLKNFDREGPDDDQ